MCKSALVSKGTTNWFMTNNFWGYTQATTGSRVGTPTPIMILKTNKPQSSSQLGGKTNMYFSTDAHLPATRLRAFTSRRAISALNVLLRFEEHDGRAPQHPAMFLSRRGQASSLSCSVRVREKCWARQKTCEQPGNEPPACVWRSLNLLFSWRWKQGGNNATQAPCHHFIGDYCGTALYSATDVFFFIAPPPTSLLCIFLSLQTGW